MFGIDVRRVEESGRGVVFPENYPQGMRLNHTVRWCLGLDRSTVLACVGASVSVRLLNRFPYRYNLRLRLPRHHRPDMPTDSLVRFSDRIVSQMGVALRRRDLGVSLKVPSTTVGVPSHCLDEHKPRNRSDSYEHFVLGRAYTPPSPDHETTKTLQLFRNVYFQCIHSPDHC